MNKVYEICFTLCRQPLFLQFILSDKQHTTRNKKVKLTISCISPISNFPWAKVPIAWINIKCRILRKKVAGEIKHRGWKKLKRIVGHASQMMITIWTLMMKKTNALICFDYNERTWLKIIRQT